MLKVGGAGGDTSAASNDPERALRFMTRLGGALHRYGTPAHRLEEALERASASLGLQGQFFSTPTELLLAFGGPEAQRTSLLRVEPGAVDLGRLAKVDEIAGGVLKGTLSLDDGIRALDELETEAPPFPATLVLFAYAMASASASLLFGGGQRELLGALILGAAMGALALLARPSQGIARVEVLLGAVVAAAGAGVLARLWGGVSASNLVLSALIGHMPGLSLTVGMIELGTQNLSSGTARLAASATRLMELGVGVAIGVRLARLLPAGAFAQSGAPANGLPVAVEPLALLLGGVAFLVLLRVRVQDIGPVLAAGYVAVYGARLGEAVLGPECPRRPQSA